MKENIIKKSRFDDKENKFGTVIRKIKNIFDEDIYYILLLIIVVLLYSLLIFNKGFPLSEGWYSVYAKMILNGAKPYVDFEFLFGPFYLYFITGFIAIFGYNIIALRILGIFVFLGMSLLAYYIFKLIFPKYIALTASLVMVFVAQSEAAQIFYDYIRIFDLLNALGILFFLKYSKKLFEKTEKNRNSDILLSGIFFSLSMLTRQSSGMLLIIFTYFLLIYFKIDRKEKGFKPFIFYSIGIFSVILILSIIFLSSGMFLPFLNMAFFNSAQSKGGLFRVLFAWIGRLFTKPMNLIIAIIVWAALFLIYKFFLSKETNQEDNKNYKTIIITTIYCFLTLILIILFFSDIGINISKLIILSYITEFIFFINFLILLTILFFYYKNKKQNPLDNKFMLLFILIYFILITGFGSGTSGGLSQGQTAYGFAIFCAVLLYLAQIYKKSIIPTILVSAFSFTFIAATSYKKVIYPYDWWLLTTPSYTTAKYKTDINIFKGIKVSENYKYILEDITNKVNQNTTADDDIYCFPQIPIFYLTTNHYPDVFSVVAWFDVANDENLLKDLEILKENNPKILIVAYCGEVAISSHEKFFRTDGTSSQRKVYEWIDDIKMNGRYEVIGSYNTNETGNDPYIIELLIKKN